MPAAQAGQASGRESAQLPTERVWDSEAPERWLGSTGFPVKEPGTGKELLRRYTAPKLRKAAPVRTTGLIYQRSSLVSLEDICHTANTVLSQPKGVQLRGLTSLPHLLSDNDGSSTRVPATYTGDLDCTLSLWIQSVLVTDLFCLCLKKKGYL